jgi:hypothetical protein
MVQSKICAIRRVSSGFGDGSSTSSPQNTDGFATGDGVHPSLAGNF